MECNNCDIQIEEDQDYVELEDGTTLHEDCFFNMALELLKGEVKCND